MSLTNGLSRFNANKKKYPTRYQQARFMTVYIILQASSDYIQWIGLRENLQENPIFNGKIYGFL